MAVFLTVVSSKMCPTCRTCEPLIKAVARKHPEVILQVWDADQPDIKRFQSRNLHQSVHSIDDKELREIYLSQGKTEIDGLPTIFISSDVQPMRIIDMMIGCVDDKSSYQAKLTMMKDIEALVQKGIKHDFQFSSTSVGRSMRRRDDYGF